MIAFLSGNMVVRCDACYTNLVLVPEDEADRLHEANAQRGEATAGVPNVYGIVGVYNFCNETCAARFSPSPRAPKGAVRVGQP